MRHNGIAVHRDGVAVDGGRNPARVGDDAAGGIYGRQGNQGHQRITMVSFKPESVIVVPSITMLVLPATSRVILPSRLR